MNELDTKQIYCLFGKYEDNRITTDEGDEYFVVSYHSLNQIIWGKIGYFNIIYNHNVECWVIFQYCLVD